MKKFVCGSLVLVSLMAGCSSTKTSTPAPIPAPTPTPEPTAAYTPAPSMPMAPSPAPAPMDMTPAPAPMDVSPAAKAPTHKTHVTHVAAASPKGSATGGTKYVIKKGDTLSQIAKSHYGTAKAVKKILAANPGLTADLIKVGQTITLP